MHLQEKKPGKDHLFLPHSFTTLPIYLPIYPSILSVHPSHLSTCPFPLSILSIRLAYPDICLSFPSIYPFFLSILPIHPSVLPIHTSPEGGFSLWVAKSRLRPWAFPGLVELSFPVPPSSSQWVRPIPVSDQFPAGSVS